MDNLFQIGDGEEAVAGCECTMSYKGTLKEGGATFDQAKKFKFCLGAGEVIKGWEVKGLKHWIWTKFFSDGKQ